MILIDPPSGWRYGFPKPFDIKNGETTGQFLKRNGYPQHLVDEGMSRYCRFIETNDPENSEVKDTRDE